jgi:hypothetical protein
MFPYSHGGKEKRSCLCYMELLKLVGSLEVWEHSKGVLQENLVILMISSDFLLGEPTSTWRFPKSWVLLRFKNA